MCCRTGDGADATGKNRLSGSAALWLVTTATAYAVLHHVGSGLAWLGTVGSTRWADWIDLVTPYAFVLPAAATLWRAGGASARAWLVYVIGAITYVEGHGIHLAANSIGNVAPGDQAHLWDEVVGHYFWFSGSMLVWAAVAMTLARRDAPPVFPSAVLAVSVGLTASTNALEGGTAVLGLAAAAGFVGWGWLTRAQLGGQLLMAFVPSLLVLVVYGLWNGGFPQPSELGWLR
jgi:hypothetical protein